MIHFNKPAAIINARSGSTSDISEPLRVRLADCSDEVGPIIYDDPADMTESVTSILEQDCDLIIIYGGDGTIRTIAQQASAHSIPSIALPGGTMNMLPNALYGTEDWEEVLETALSCDAPRWISGGQIGEDLFLCACLLGTPTHLNEVREHMRDMNILEAVEDFVFRAMDFDASDLLSYRVEEKADMKTANLLNVACPLMREKRGDQSVFDIDGITVDKLTDIAALGVSAIVSDWRKSRTTQSDLSNEIHIESQIPVDALLDGEPKRFKSPFRISMTAKGALFLAP